jgi:hypothetical protein
MATIHRILDIARRAINQPAKPTAPVTPVQSAEIILFPGVRYERWSEHHAQVTPVQRRGKRRDRLDVAE